MKRHLEEDSFPSEQTNNSKPSSDEKRIKINAGDVTTNQRSNNFVSTLDDDCMGEIFSFIPLVNLCECRLVGKGWNQIIESDKVPVFYAIRNMVNYCLESEWKENRNDELYISLLKWLTGKEISIKRDGSSYFVDTPNPLVVDKFPAMTFISSTNGWVEGVSYYEIMLHIKENVKIRMHMHLSATEDEIVYLNVEQNADPSFDWKPFEIDPNTRNVLVHRVKGSGEECADNEVEEYSHNSAFFEQIGAMFGSKEETRSFYFSLLNELLERHKEEYTGEMKINENEECEQACQYKYSDELREQLIQKPLLGVKNVEEAVSALKNVVVNIYSSSLNRIYLDEDLIVNIYDVVGKAFVNGFRENLHDISSKFKISFKKTYECEMGISQRFYYQTDGYEGEHLFTIKDTESGQDNEISGRAYGTEESVVWYGNEGFQTLTKLGLDAQFENLGYFIEYTIDSILEKLPIIDSFHCVSADKDTLRTFLIGNTFD